MAHGFVKQSGGHIRIYSEANHGTTIRIYLPRSMGGEDKTSFPMLGNADGGNETILVVEDDLAVQVTVVDILTGLGYKVLKADNAEEALEIVKEGRTVDLLFTDVVMPGTLRSPDLAREAKILIPNLQVLFTSGYTQNAIVHGGRLDPGVHLLSKPYGRDQLARKVRELLSCREIADSESGAAPVNDMEYEAQMKIALVEDNEGFRHVVTKMLTMMGYQVESFASAEHALDCFESGRFSVLLTDISLPGMSGIELASVIYKSNPDIKIILASGYGDGVVANAVDFKYQMLSKPFSVDQLIHCLANH